MDPVYRIKHFLALAAVGRASEVFPAMARSLPSIVILCSVILAYLRRACSTARTVRRALIYLCITLKERLFSFPK